MSKIENIITKDELAIFKLSSDNKYADKGDVPENMSELYNDQDYQTASDVTTKVNSALENYDTKEKTESTIQEKIQEAATSGDWQSAAQVQAAIDEATKDFVGLKFDVVDTLPGEGKEGVIYLKKNDGGANDYAEYVWLKDVDGGRFEALGSVTAPDLTNYLQVSDISVCPKGDILAMFSA